MSSSMKYRPLQCGLLVIALQWVNVHAQGQTPLEVESVVLRPLQVAEVPAQHTGLLLKIIVTEGQRVEKDQPLAALDPREAKLAISKAKLQHAQADAEAKNQIQVQYAEKALEVARAELVRSQESIRTFPKSISQSQLDVERLTVEKLVLERQQAKHDLSMKRYEVQLRQNELDATRLRWEQHQIRAPFAGTIVVVRGRKGEWVELGESVLQLMAVDHLRAEGFVAVQLATSALVGKKVNFHSEVVNKDVSATGTVRFVSPEMDPVTRQVRIWAEIANPGNSLQPGEQGVLEIAP